MKMRNRQIEVKMPWLTPKEVEIQVVRWLVAPGDRVEIDQDILELTVDQEKFILPSPLDGVLLEVEVEPGDYLATDQVLAIIKAD
ncbi:MAG TPA: biotin/lipoyl-containing protein [Bacillota bacterium]